MLFSELYKIMVNKVTFVGLGWAIPPWILPYTNVADISVTQA